MGKVISAKQAAVFSKKRRTGGKTVGLIVGSFDIVHLGHINLFRYAKKHVDYLIVGLDNDETIRLVKGKNRPVNNLKWRSQLLAALTTIDKIFEIDSTNHHDSEEAYVSYEKLLKNISPTHIITHKVCDKSWLKKKKLALDNNITFLLDKTKRVTNSGAIIQKIMLDL